MRWLTHHARSTQGGIAWFARLHESCVVNRGQEGNALRHTRRNKKIYNTPRLRMRRPCRLKHDAIANTNDEKVVIRIILQITFCSVSPHRASGRRRYHSSSAVLSRLIVHPSSSDRWLHILRGCLQRQRNFVFGSMSSLHRGCVDNYQTFYTSCFSSFFLHAIIFPTPDIMIHREYWLAREKGARRK